jgi:colicin import membrane protein
MDPGKTGIRRYGVKTADPVVCIGTTCWVSAGPDKSAIEAARGKVLGPGNTLGRRAAACNHSLGCVFRDVDLKSDMASLQPIDLRIMRHDRRQPLAVKTDRSCDFDGRQLYCATLFRAKDWRAWIVPEPLAREVGEAALKAAIERGLPVGRAAALDGPARW